MWEPEIIAIVDLVYFVPALVLAILVSVRHGFSKQLGWASMIMLSLFRIGGGISTIVAVYHPSVGAFTAAFVMDSFGLVSLIIGLHGFGNRLNAGMSGYQYPERLFRLSHLAMMAGIGLTIAGVVDVTDGNPANDHQGWTYRKAGMGIFIAILALVGLAISGIVARSRQLAPAERPLLIATAISLPLVIVRLIYSALVTFQYDPAVFNSTGTSTRAVAARVCMTTVVEFIVVALWLVAGFRIPRLPKQGRTPPAADATAAEQGYAYDAHGQPTPYQPEKAAQQGTGNRDAKQQAVAVARHVPIVRLFFR